MRYDYVTGDLMKKELVFCAYPSSQVWSVIMCLSKLSVYLSELTNKEFDFFLRKMKYSVFYMSF